MIEEITTNIVQCDGANCDEVYADVVPLDHETIARFAKRDGWAEGSGGTWHCPACRIQQADPSLPLIHEVVRKLDETCTRLLKGQFTPEELSRIATILPPDDLALALLQTRRAVAEREGDAP